MLTENSSTEISLMSQIFQISVHLYHISHVGLAQTVLPFEISSTDTTLILLNTVVAPLTLKTLYFNAESTEKY